MVMRYHWGLGIGHTHSRGNETGIPELTAENQQNSETDGNEDEGLYLTRSKSAGGEQRAALIGLTIHLQDFHIY
jgi:hypothetical protein